MCEAELKKQIIDDYNSGKSVAVITKELGRMLNQPIYIVKPFVFSVLYGEIYGKKYKIT